MNKKVCIFAVFCAVALLMTGCKSLSSAPSENGRSAVTKVKGIDPDDMPENRAHRQESDFSCKGVNTSKIDKNVLKKVLKDMAEMERNLTKNLDKFENFTDWRMGGAPEGFYYDDPYSNPWGFSVRTEHKKGGENIVIYGPVPSVRFHQCIMPVTEDADRAFCCAVQELNGNYAVRQYNIETR